MGLMFRVTEPPGQHKCSVYRLVPELFQNGIQPFTAVKRRDLKYGIKPILLIDGFTFIDLGS
ncbi:hypothetical protein D3C80_1909380 [compost metagenome]